MNLLLWLVLLVLILLLVFVILLIVRINALNKEMRHQSRDQSLLLDEHFHQESRSLMDVENQLGALSRQLDRSRDNLSSMDEQLQSLAQVLAHPKQRGVWGEVHMENLIQDVLGESGRLFSRQYRLENGRIADGVFFLPDQNKLLCIDSKFPLENFEKLMQDPSLRIQKELIRNIKKHIDDISHKYITEQTLPVALLFLPSEGIYSYLCAHQPELLSYAYSKGVLITSPTTLIGVVSTLLGSSREFYHARNLQGIQKSLSRLTETIDELAKNISRIRAQQQSQLANLQRAEADMESLQYQIERIITSDPFPLEGEKINKSGKSMEDRQKQA